MKRFNVRDIVTRKKNGEKLTMVTCYDYSFARIIDKANLDLVLVGDSLGNVILGYEDTIKVRLNDVVHHVRAVARGLTTPMLCADMPFLTCHGSPPQILQKAGRLIQAGAQAVKLEGGREICPQVEALVQAGIPVMGHLGFTPQHIHSMGGYVVQGRNEERSEQLLTDAHFLQEAGVFALVLELVPASLAREITARLTIPTIGIGAGIHCDGQVLVLHDLLGCNPDFNPKFLKKYTNLAEIVHNAVKDFSREVKEGEFPEHRHEYE